MRRPAGLTDDDMPEAVQLTLKNIGCKPTISDPQIYTYHKENDFAVIYHLYSELAKTFELSINPDMSYYLGMDITRDRAKKSIFINRPRCIDSLVEDYDIGSKLFPLTPMRTDNGNSKSLFNS